MENQKNESTEQVKESINFNWRHLYYSPYILLMVISYLTGIVLLSFVALGQYLAQNVDYDKNFMDSEKTIRNSLTSIFTE